MEYEKTYMWREIADSERITREFLLKSGDMINAVSAAVERRGITNICLAGRGTSDHALIFFKYVVESLSQYTAGYVAPSIVTIYDGKIDFGNSLVIGCSQSGYAADVIAVIERAKAQGAVTLGVTNDESSPLAAAAQFHICLSAGKETSVAATKTFTAQLYALLMLACSLAHRADLIEKYSHLSERMPAYHRQADELTTAAAERLKGMKDGFCLARGYTYAMAFESALKLQETCYIRMRGYSTSDFYHGPMAMVGEGTTLIMFAPEYYGSDERQKANHLADQKKCIDKMLSLGADVTLVTDSDALTVYEGKVQVSKFNAVCDEIESIFPFAIYAQMLACKISCALGLDPDNPKALNKVTITR